METKKTRNSIVAGTALMAAALAYIGFYEDGGKIRLEAYLDQGGVPTICKGVTGKDIKLGMVVTKEWCRKREEAEIERHSLYLNQVKYQLPPHVILAFSDFGYQYGEPKARTSTAFRQLQTGKVTAACDALLMWKFTRVDGVKRDCSKAGSKCSGIWTRTQDRRKLCLNQITADEFIRKYGATKPEWIEYVSED